MIWPGLNAPVIEGKKIVKQRELPSDNSKLEKLTEIRNRMGRIRISKLDPLERGWSGRKIIGRDIGPPIPIGDQQFEGFKTIALEYKPVSVMHGRLGRKRSLSLLVVSGNGNGLAGFALAKGNTLQSCKHLCMTRVAQRLIYFERCDNHTIYHNFFSQYLFTKVFVERRPQGYGLRCSRVIREICKVIGIKNLYAKINGSTNVQNVTKAFILGLLKQKTHQQLADEKQLHVVSIRPNDMPRILANPQSGVVRSKNDISMDEEIDYDLYTMGGKVILPKVKKMPDYMRFPKYESYCKSLLVRRNRRKIRRQQLVEYGRVISFLTEKYPECDDKFIVREVEE